MEGQTAAGAASGPARSLASRDLPPMAPHPSLSGVVGGRAGTLALSGVRGGSVRTRGVSKLLKSPLATAVTQAPGQKEHLRRSLERTARRAAGKQAAETAAAEEGPRRGGGGGAPELSAPEQLRKQQEALSRKQHPAQRQQRATRGRLIDLTGSEDPTPLSGTVPGLATSMSSALDAAMGTAGKASSAMLSSSWRRPDHAVSRRREASQWADPARQTELETGLGGAAAEVTRALGETRHREDWSSHALHTRFRDESVRFEAWVQSRAAAEEAAALEQESGVVVPVAVADPHPVWDWTQSLVARENAAARKRARARSLRKVYSLDVRAVWLAGDLPAEAPLPWRAAPHGGAPAAAAGRAGAGGRASAEEIVARRALAGRRDAAALRAGHHQIQSVSLQRAMADAVVTPVSEAAEVQRLVREAPERRRLEAEAGARAAAARAAPRVVAVIPWFGTAAVLSHAPRGSRLLPPGDAAAGETPPAGALPWRLRPLDRVARVRVSRELPLDRETLLEPMKAAAAPAGGEPTAAASPAASDGVVFFDQGRQVHDEVGPRSEGKEEPAAAGRGGSGEGKEDDGLPHPRQEEEEEEEEEPGEAATLLGRGRTAAVVLEVTVELPSNSGAEPPRTRRLRARVPGAVFAQVLLRECEERLPALEAAVGEAEAAHQRLMRGIAAARERRAVAVGGRADHFAPAAEEAGADGGGETASPRGRDRSPLAAGLGAAGYSAAAAAAAGSSAARVVRAAAGGSGAAGTAAAGDGYEDAWEEEQSAAEAGEEAAAEAAAREIREARSALQEAQEAASWAQQVSAELAPPPPPEGADPGAGEPGAETVVIPAGPVRRADAEAALAHLRGHVAGVRGPDGDGALRVSGASSSEPPAPPSGAVRAVVSLLQLVLAHEPPAVGPRGSRVREWAAAAERGVGAPPPGSGPGSGGAVTGLAVDAAGADAACGPGPGGVRSVGRFDDGGRTAGEPGEAVAFAGAVWGAAELRAAREDGLNPCTAEQTAVGLGGAAPWAPEAWTAIAEGGGAVAAGVAPGSVLVSREAAAQAVARTALRGGRAALGGGGEALLPPELTPAQLGAVAEGVSAQGAAALAAAMGVTGALTLPAPHLRALSLALDPPLAAVLSGAAAAGLMARVPGAAVVGRLEQAVALLSRDRTRSRAGHLVAVLVAAVDAGEVVRAGVAEDFEGAAGKGLAPRVELPGRDEGALRPSAALLLSAPSLLPSLASANDWCLAPTITLLGDAAEDAADAPGDAALPGFRRGGAAPERMPFGAPRGERQPESQAEADAAPALRGVAETATARLGFRLWERVPAARPRGALEGSSFGVTRGSAVPNAPTLWPRRFTWHSSVAVRTGPSHTWRDFVYILENRSVSSGPNEPTTFTSRMDFERCARVDSASLRALQDLERRGEEHRAELRRRADEAARLQRAAEAKARKAKARAELARQWREKHIRDAARLRGSAPTLGLSEADWHAMRSAPGAQVTARHLGWERWVHLEADPAGRGAGHGAGAAAAPAPLSAVWYHHPESGASAWDPPGAWPEEDALAADGASLEDAIRAAGTLAIAPAASDLPGARDRAREEAEAAGRAAAELPVSATVLLAGASTSLEAAARRAAAAQDEPWLLPSRGLLGSQDAAAACEEVVVRALLAALRRWVCECAARGCVDPGAAFKPPVARAAGRREADPGDEDGSHPQRALEAAAAVVAAGEAPLDGFRRLGQVRRRAARAEAAPPGGGGGGEEESDYDDGDVAGMDCGVEPGSGGEGRGGGPWRPGLPADRFSVGEVFLFLDRDGDGVVSARDWAVLLAGGGAGAGRGAAGAGAAPSVAALAAPDRVAGEVMRAGMWPYFRAALDRLTPPALRPLLAARLPSLLDEDTIAAVNGWESPADGEDEAADGAARLERPATAQRRLEQGRDPDGADSGREAAALLASVLSPAVRLRAFRALKRQRAFFPRAADRDKRPQHLRYDELVRWLCGAAEGTEWFGVDTVSGLHAPVASWGSLQGRQLGAQAAAEWVPGADPASGDVYWASALTGASVWEKGAPQLQSEAALRRAAVALLDTETRSQEAMFRQALRRARRQARRVRRRLGGPQRRPKKAEAEPEPEAPDPAAAGTSLAEQLAHALATDDALVRALAERLGLPVPPSHGGLTAQVAGPAPADAATNEASGTSAAAAAAAADETVLAGASLPGAVSWDEEAYAEVAGGGAAAGAAVGMEWRQLRPPSDARRLRARAKESHVLGAHRSEGVNLCNGPRVVGLVAPRDVTAAPPRFQPPVVAAVLLADLSAAAAGASLRVSVDPRTGERVVVEAAEDDGAEGDKTSQDEAVAAAFSAVRAGRVEVLRDQLVSGLVDVNASRDAADNTLFIVAAQNGNKRLCKELLRKGADINARNAKGNTALHFCFAYGFGDLGEYLVEKGADDTIANAEGVAPREGLTSGAVAAI